MLFFGGETDRVDSSRIGCDLFHQCLDIVQCHSMQIMLLPVRGPFRAFSMSHTMFRSYSDERSSIYKSSLHKLCAALLVVLTLFAVVRPLAAQVLSADSSATKVLGAAKDDVRIEDLKALNSIGDDATSFFSASDGSIYFTSSRADGKYIIYASKRLPPTDANDHSSHWGHPEVFAELPGKQNVSSLSLAADGVTAVVGISNRPESLLDMGDIFQGELIGGKLDHITLLPRPINSEWWQGQPCISQDGQLLFYTSDRKGGRGGMDIYMCSKTMDGKWSDPINLSFNTGGDEMAPFIARDNQTLYFAANHLPGGQGGYDIYVTRRAGDNQWTEPKNLGPTINSKANELFFYLPPNEDAVYFSSDREGGMGGYDLYRAYVQPAPPKPKYVTLAGRILDAETKQPITTAPEISATFSNNGNAISNDATGPSYSVRVLVGSLIHISAGAVNYVSNALEIQAPTTDEQPTITQDITLTPSHARVFGHVTNAYNDKPLATTVTLEQLAGGAAPVSVQTDAATGAFTFNVNPLISYKISTSLTDYQPYEDKIDVPAAREKLISIQKEIRLTPFQVQGFVVYFDVDKSDLTPEELTKFPDFVRQVKQNPHVRFEINGHTDSTGSIEYNVKLSERRANSVEQYLLGQDVPRDQIAVVQGFGKSHPLDPNNLAKNRRVEVRIVGKQD